MPLFSPFAAAHRMPLSLAFAAPVICYHYYSAPHTLSCCRFLSAYYFTADYDGYEDAAAASSMPADDTLFSPHTLNAAVFAFHAAIIAFAMLFRRAGDVMALPHIAITRCLRYSLLLITIAPPVFHTMFDITDFSIALPRYFICR